MNTAQEKIISVAKHLWQKGLVGACSGNISLKHDKDSLYVTAHHSCLGLLRENDIVRLSLDGNFRGKKQPTMEKSIHLAIQNSFSFPAVIHAHPPLTTAYFSVRDTLICPTHEARLLLGNVPCVMQRTAHITNEKKVIAALRKSNIVALKEHGVIAMGKDLYEAFFLIQMLEDAIKVNFAAQLFRVVS